MTSQPPPTPRRRWRNLGVGLRFSLVFSVVLALIAMLAGLGFYVVQAYQQTGDATRLSAERMVELEALEGLVLDQQSSLRGFLISGQRGFLDDYETARSRFERRLARARSMMHGEAEQLEAFDRIDAAMTQWRREFAEPGLYLRRNEQGEALREHFEDGGGQRLVATIRAELFEATQRERQRLDSLDSALAERARTVQVIGAAGVLAVLVIMLLTVRLMMRTVVQPLNALADATRKMAAGDEEVPIGFTGQRDEIGDIARALDAYYAVNRDVARDAWVTAHVVDITDAVVHEAAWPDLAGALLGKLCPAVGAVSGALFRVDSDSDVAQCIGSWAGRPASQAPKLSFAPGEGLVGECLRSREAVALRELPADYMAVRTGTGGAAPRLLRLEPLFAGDSVVGVLELIFLSEPDAARSKLLADIVGPVGLSMARLDGSLRTRELLDRSQAQAQELQRSEEALRQSESELRSQAQELRAANAELVERGESLRRASEAIQKQNEEIERASRYKSEFLANMSHELRTPLNALLILARTLVDNDEGNLSADQVESAQIIHDSGQNLLRLINNVLDLSKIEAGRVEIAREAMDLRGLLRALERQFRPLAESKSLQLRVNCDAALDGTFYGDADKLRQVLTNLIGNAIKFTERGEVVVSASRDASRDGDAAGTVPLHVSVRDTGIGIPPGLHQRIFGAFEQADSSTSRRYGGSGLGLTISLRLVEAMGGTLELDSDEGKGSCFVLRLPLGRDAPSPAATASPVSVPVAPPRAPALPLQVAAELPDSALLLIVEDDPQLSRVLAAMARQHGCETVQAGNGRDAIRMAQQHLPAGIILDVGLPDMDGWAVFDALKRNTSTAAIPVHFVTAREDAERARAAGAASYLTKPVSQAELQPILEAIARRSPATPILLVEGDDATAKALRRMFDARSDLRLIRVRDGAEALRLCENTRVAAMLLHLSLPDMDGTELLDAVERLGAVPPVIVYSGRDLDPEELRRLRAHTAQVVVKDERAGPALLAAVDQALQRAPARPTPREPVEGTAASVDDGALRGRKILLVDDDVRSVFALSKALRARGLDVRMANDGAKALAVLESEEGADIELVLMDVMMPGMDGFETMRRLRALPAHRELPVIALTAKAMAGDREACLQAGASDYLSKPVDVDRLCAMMREWLPAAGADDAGSDGEEA